MFSYFENLIDPFKPASAERPPGDSVFRFIYYFAAQARFVFLGVLVFGGLQAWIEISMFGFIGRVVDMLDGADVNTVFADHWQTFAWMVLFIGVIRVLIMAMGILLLEQTIGPSVFNLIRWQSHKNVVRQSLNYFQNDFAGRIATKVIQAGQAVSDFLITLLDTVWLIVLYVISTLVLFMDLDWRLTLFLVFWVCIYAVILYKYVPSVRVNAREVANAKSVLTGRLVDSYSNINLVKLDSKPEREDAFVADGMHGLIATVRQFGRTIACFLAQVNGLFRNLGQAQDSMQSVAQPVDLLDKPDATELHVPSGQIDGLVGPSGAGKSTLVNLLLRLYDIDSGTIEIDRQAISDVTQSSLRSSIGMVSQDTALLHRSIRENIAFARPDATEQQILAAAGKAHALEFLNELQDGRGRQGLDAYVGERGVKLSGGQRQRIAIARVLLKDAPILVLDEATSALDSEVEAAIQTSLQDLMEGKTVIAIAHRLSTIAAMDRLVVIEDGRIVETGTHDELVANAQRYASLWSRQSGGFIDVS